MYNTDISYQFRPYSELHKNRFNEHPDQEEHPGGSLALAFDIVKFEADNISYDLQSKYDTDTYKDDFTTILRIFFGDL